MGLFENIFKNSFQFFSGTKFCLRTLTYKTKVFKQKLGANHARKAYTNNEYGKLNKSFFNHHMILILTVMGWLHRTILKIHSIYIHYFHQVFCAQIYYHNMCGLGR